MKLSSLLPRDYSRGWQKYRPPDTSNLRFKRLRGDRGGPSCSSQQDTACSETSLENGSNTRTLQSCPHLESFEGPLSAFRNYSSQDADTLTTSDSITLSTSDSILLVPSRLLLDGSSVDGWWPSRNGGPMSISIPAFSDEHLSEFWDREGSPKTIKLRLLSRLIFCYQLS
jgi:hypothetical protein